MLPTRTIASRLPPPTSRSSRPPGLSLHLFFSFFLALSVVPFCPSIFHLFGSDLFFGSENPAAPTHSTSGYGNLAGARVWCGLRCKALLVWKFGARIFVLFCWDICFLCPTTRSFFFLRHFLPSLETLTTQPPYPIFLFLRFTVKKGSVSIRTWEIFGWRRSVEFVAWLVECITMWMGWDMFVAQELGRTSGWVSDIMRRVLPVFPGWRRATARMV